MAPLEIDVAHNFGVPRDGRWETDFDLEASGRVEADGTETALPLACRPLPGFRMAPAARVAALVRPVLQKLARVAPGGFAALPFVLSNERDGGWWAAFSRHHRLVRATDFPDPADTLCTNNGALRDNYLLYAVEKEVMRHAARRRVRRLVSERIWAAGRSVRDAWRTRRSGRR